MSDDPNTHERYEEAGDEIDLMLLLGTVIDGRYVLAIALGLGLLLSLSYALLATPVYKVDGLILVEDNVPGVPGFDDLSAVFAVESKSMTEIEVLKSRMILGRVVDELALDIQVEAEFFPVFGAAVARYQRGESLAAPWFGLASYAWGGEQVAIHSLSVPRSLEGQDLKLVAEDTDRFTLWNKDTKLLSGKVGAQAVGIHGQVTIRVAQLKARPGTEFIITKVNRLKRIIDLQKKLSVVEKGKDTGVIAVSLENSDGALASKIVDSVMANYYLQNVQRLSLEAEGSLKFLEQQIPKVKTLLATSEEALNNYRSERTSVDLTLEAKSALEGLAQIEADISTMSNSEADISRRFTSEHPNYISFKRQQVNLLEQREKLNGKLEELPDTQKKMLRLMRDFEVNQAIFIALENRRQELEIVKASTVGNVRILDTAEIAPRAVAPNKTLIVLLGAVLGGSLGLIIVFGQQFLKAGVGDPARFSEKGFNLLATIPYSENEIAVRSETLPFRHFKSRRSKLNQDKYNLLAHDHPADLAVEALRSLRTSLYFTMLDSNTNTMIISSGSPGVGKSFISANLAVVMAQSGQRVLLVDADMRKGYVHKRFRIQGDHGLSEVLSGTLAIEEAVNRTKVDNLFVMSRGAIPPNPSELLTSSRTSEVLEALNQSFDLVLLDTPPILAVTDAAILGRHTNTLVMVTRFESCTVREVLAAEQRFKLSGTSVNGLVFNAVERKASSYYYDYGYYNYEYKSESDST